MYLKRITKLVFALLICSPWAIAQKADVAFVAGGSFTTDAQVFQPIVCIAAPCIPTVLDRLNTSHQVFLEGALAVRMLDAKAASLYLEGVVAGVPSQRLWLSSAPSLTHDHMSTVFFTPGLKVKLLPASPVAPFASLGGGVARFSFDSSSGANTKAALQYGGGVDIKSPTPALGFRAEVRDFLTGFPNLARTGLASPNPLDGLRRHNVMLGGGVVLKF